MIIDIERLTAILKDAARTEILPRFRHLAAADIRQKTSAIDLVTEADEAAERAIQGACAAAWPDMVFVGEESTAADPALLGRVGSAELAVVVDPIDGTANFAAGVPLFAVMAAVVSRGETVAGVIYDPMSEDAVVAERGAGAWVTPGPSPAARLRVAPAVPVADMVGSASHTYHEPGSRRALMAALSAVRVLANYRCAGHEYRLSATGGLHFQIYAKLMPWDHLAGALILTEAGGHVRRLDGSPYRASDVDGGLLCAGDPESWQAIRSLLPAHLD